ncbi:hypothetical protein Tco_1370601 [Tanacetum coccineum]
MAGYKHNQSKNKSFDDIQKLFDKSMKMVTTFVDMDTELVEGSEKRAGEELMQESEKKQKVDDDKETAELKLSRSEFIPALLEVTADSGGNGGDKRGEDGGLMGCDEEGGGVADEDGGGDCTVVMAAEEVVTRWLWGDDVVKVAVVRWEDGDEGDSGGCRPEKWSEIGRKKGRRWKIFREGGLNKLAEVFEKRFVPQQELSAEQKFWLQSSDKNSEEPSTSNTPVKIEVPSELSKVSLVNKSLKKLSFHLASFDKVVKVRTTPDAITERREREKELQHLQERQRQSKEVCLGYFEAIKKHLKSLQNLRFKCSRTEVGLKELSSVHDTFHVSNLKKCLADANLHVPLDEIKVDETLRFVEEPLEIMDREVKILKRSKIPIVKVRWNSKHGPEFTWEREDQMKAKYPQLFENANVKTNG